MPNLIWSVGFTIFSIAFISFVLRQKLRYSEHFPPSWKIVGWGVICLVIGNGIYLLFILNRTRYASLGWSQIMYAIQISCYAAGGSLILAGFWKWCSSLAEIKKNASRRLRQLAYLHSLLSVINHRHEPDEILKDSLRNLLSIMGYKMGMIFKSTFDSSEMKVVAYGGMSPQNLYMLMDVYSKNIWYQEAIKSKEVTTTTVVDTLQECGVLSSDQDPIRSFACVPIKYCGKIAGLLGLYDSRPDRFSYQETQFLSDVGGILGLSARQNMISNRNKKRRNYISAVENLLSAVRESATLEEVFPRISAEIKRIIDFDHLSLLVTTGGGGDLKRISLGNSGSVLVERRTGNPAEGSIIGKVISSKEIWVDRNASQSGNRLDDYLGKACGINSRIFLPLCWGKRVYGVLSLGHKQPSFYSPNDGRWLKACSFTLSHLIFEQLQRDRLIRKESLTRSLDHFEKRLVDDEDIFFLIQDLAVSLTSDLPKSFARVTLLNDQGDQLISCATHRIRLEGIELRNDQKFPLQDLPWHRLALETRKPLRINQDDPESFMSRGEARLIMDERVNSAILVPLIIQNKAVGVISVGEMRNWDRQPVTDEEIAFMEHRADQVCVALSKGLLSRNNARLKDRLKRNEMTEDLPHPTVDHPPFWQLGYQINNSLTAIRGSVELLRLSQPGLNSGSQKYLKNIEQGVDRILRNIEEYLSSDHDSHQVSRIYQPEKDPVSI